jgi:hypothetical protein
MSIIDPPVVVTREMISDYERDGAVLVRQPFNGAWVDGIREGSVILDKPSYEG